LGIYVIPNPKPKPGPQRFKNEKECTQADGAILKDEMQLEY